MSNTSSEKQAGAMTNNDSLEQTNTATSVAFGPQHVEKLVSALENSHAAQRKLTSTTAVGLGGFILCTTPLSVALLGWQGAGGAGAANLGSWLWLGGFIAILGAIGDWITGHTFPAIVFALFGGFFVSFGTMMIPDAGAYALYSPDASDPYAGLTQPAFLATVAFLLMSMSILCFIFMLASIRINVAFLAAFAGLIPTLDLLAASYWAGAHGHSAQSTTLQHASGGVLFAVSLLGWYILAALILPTVDFPVVLPLGDLSQRVKGASQRAQERNPSYDV